MHFHRVYLLNKIWFSQEKALMFIKKKMYIVIAFINSFLKWTFLFHVFFGTTAFFQKDISFVPWIQASRN